MLTLNLDLIFASSLLILLTSASLLLQFLMSEMKTARPRMPSPLTAGMLALFGYLQGPLEGTYKFIHQYLKIRGCFCTNTTFHEGQIRLIPSCENIRFTIACWSEAAAASVRRRGALNRCFCLQEDSIPNTPQIAFPDLEKSDWPTMRNPPRPGVGGCVCPPDGRWQPPVRATL